MPRDAPTAFFSYSREDSQFALRLAEDLKAAGADVWLDQLDIAPGQRWARAVEQALRISPRVLIILSPSSVNSTNVEDEVNFALDEQKTVIPIFYQDCKIPFRLRPLQYVDFRTDYAHGLEIMLKTLGVKEQSTANPAAAPPSPRTRRSTAAHSEEEGVGKEPPLHTTQTATSSMRAPIDWNAAIRYAQLINAAYAISPQSLEDPTGIVISDVTDYTVILPIYGNDLSTDINPARGRAVINFGFLARSKSGELVVALRGSEGIQEWIHDHEYLEVLTPFANSAGHTEDGFAAVYLSLRTGVGQGSLSLIAAIKKQIKSGFVKEITICGHSLGAALATLTALDLALNSRNKAPVIVYTYGSPRVGDPMFVQAYKQAVPKTFRIVVRLDHVPQLPLPPQYEHAFGLNELSSVTLGTPPKVLIKPDVACLHILSSYLYLMSLQAGGPVLPLSPQCAP